MYESGKQTIKSQKPSLLKFIGALIQQDLSNCCRRQFSRHSLRVTLAIQPLTDDYANDGESFQATSSDISLKGMAIVNSEPIHHPYVRVSFVQYNISVIAKIRHNSSIGVEYPLYLVGVEFLDEYY